MRIVPRVAPEQVVKIDAAEQVLMQTNGGGGTFFHRKTVPLRFRSMDYTTKSGESIKIATIHDVIAWAKWKNKSEIKREAERKQDTMFPEDKFLGCTSSMGSCE